MKKIFTHCSMVASLLAGAALASTAHATTDPFYTYTGNTPLSSIPLGTVVNQRTVTYDLAGFPTKLTAVQLLYRTNNAQNQAVVNVTTILKSPTNSGKAISYQSFYDSLNPADEPSQVIAGNKGFPNFTIGNSVATAESVVIAGMMSAGYTVIVPDSEGQTADFAAGPEYGMTTLDSIRAALNTPASGLTPLSKVAMAGYSGGAIATNWAAQLAPTYAPDVNQQLVGATYGGVLVDPIHNLNYVNGSVVWGGVAAMALVGLARSYNIDMTPYLSSTGQAVANDIQNQGIAYILTKYATLKWATLLKPQYANDIYSIPALVYAANKADAGLVGSPTTPIQIVQGTVGLADGNFNLQPGDGVMLSNDVRTLAKQFCTSGTSVQYIESPTDHFSTVPVWVAALLPWINARFTGTPAPSNCALVKWLPSNSLAAQTVH